MKKRLIVLILFNSGFLAAQLNFDFGLRTGLNFLPTSKDETTGRQYYAGFNGGGLLVKHFSKSLALKAELNFANKAKEFSYSQTSSLLTDMSGALGALGGFTGGGFDINSLMPGISGFVNDTVYSYYSGVSKFGFIELPLIFTYTYKQFDIGVGGYFSFLTYAKTTTKLTQQAPGLSLIQPLIDSLGFAASFVNGIIDNTYPGLYQPEITESILKDEFIKVDYGFVADLTYHYHPRLFFNLRYQIGFQNYRITPLNDPDRYSSFTFSFGYLFSMAEKETTRFM